MHKSKKAEIAYIKGVGPKRAEAFEKLGLKYADDLFSVYPRDYLINSKIRSLVNYIDKNVLISGEIIEKYIPRWPNHPTKIAVYDGSASIECIVWGNTYYRDKQFKEGDKYLFWGKVSKKPFESNIQFDLRDHKKFEPGDEDLLKYPLIPVYILSGELKKTWIRPLNLTKIIFNALKNHSGELGELLSRKIITENNLMEHRLAVLRTHYPHSDEEIEQARQTLAFEELFYLQLAMALKRRSISDEESGISFEKVGENIGRMFNELLGFELTNAQKRVIKEIRSDMRSKKPMNRLLQGDVGSGKTIVAVFCMLIAIENGYQCAFMAPTEILAEQHMKTLSNYFESLGIKIDILTGGQKKKLREGILADIKSGKTNVVIGTHALIQDKVEFNSLGFIVIDEQHKFGVMQRARLREKGVNPDVLVMTATPIPRTLSLTLYGDLDVSVINELPKNRKSIKTAIRKEEDRLKVYTFIRKEVSNGRQAYIVYPIIDDSEKLDLKSAVLHYEILSKEIYNDLKVGLIHGRMPWNEIDNTIELFKNGKLDILVSTTVIEVGIDIPNASIMLVEEAQRFGLSQLHQLRGRVGRGAEQSFCILMADKLSNLSTQRLKILEESTDGFVIAETDMKLRGPGEFFGTRQSGELKFTAADLAKDIVLVEKARESAFRLVEADPQLREKDNTVIRDHFGMYYKESVNLIKAG
ncbi:MAG: ATP-dependent DNA helicase RecG [Ignavibacteria bacterium]|nr:ATP-dependent DNA helicase RecG [Ignavibacteria bacterium]